MFKKTTVTQAARPLNGKDVKLLRADLQAAFPNLQVDQVMIDRPRPPLAATPRGVTLGNACRLSDMCCLSLTPFPQRSWTSSCRRKLP